MMVHLPEEYWEKSVQQGLESRARAGWAIVAQGCSGELAIGATIALTGNTLSVSEE
jgi:hypothetical protein